MFNFLKKRLSNEKGAMDKIIVTLLLVFIAISGIIGLSTWSINNKNTIEMQAVAEIDAILERDAPASGGDQGNHFGQFKQGNEGIGN